MNLFNIGDGDTSSFIANGEWILQGMPSKRHVTKFRCCPHPYVYLTYNIHIKRRSLYYVLNCFMPCLIMMALTILSFYLPSETGERMGVGITVLLSLSIIQLILSDSLPPTSEVPLIVVYYGLTMLNIFMSLVFSCVVLTLYHHTAVPLPRWMRTSLCEWGVKLVRMQQEWIIIQEKRKQIEIKQKFSGNDIITKGAVVNWIPEISLPSQTQTTELITGQSLDERSSETENDFLLSQRYREEDKAQILREEWKFASRVVNKFFMWIIVMAIISNALYVVLKAPRGNFILNWTSIQNLKSHIICTWEFWNLRRSNQKMVLTREFDNTVSARDFHFVYSAQEVEMRDNRGVRFLFLSHCSRNRRWTFTWRDLEIRVTQLNNYNY